jgi:hypothetical protein
MNWTELNQQVDAKRKEYAELDTARSRVMSEMHVLAMTNGCKHARDCMYTTADAQNTRGCYGCDREELLEMKRQATLIDVIIQSPLKPSPADVLVWVRLGKSIGPSWRVGGHKKEGVGTWFVILDDGEKHYLPTNQLDGWMPLIKPSAPNGLPVQEKAA